MHQLFDEKNSEKRILTVAAVLYLLLALTTIGLKVYANLEEIKISQAAPRIKSSNYREFMNFYSINDKPVNHVQVVNNSDDFLEAPGCRLQLSTPLDSVPVRFTIRNGCIAELTLRYKDYLYQYDATRDPYQNITSLSFHRYSSMVRSYDRVKLDFATPEWFLHLPSSSGRIVSAKFRFYDRYAKEISWKSDGVRYNMIIYRNMNPRPGKPIDEENAYKPIDNYADLIALARDVISKDVR